MDQITAPPVIEPNIAEHAMLGTQHLHRDGQGNQK